MKRALSKLTAPLRRGLALMVGRGTIKLVDDSTKMQTAQVALLDGEVRDGVEVVQYWGLTSVPHVDSEAVLVAAGGNRDHLLMVGHGDRRYRLIGLQSGEVALHDDQGLVILLSRNGIVINGGGKDIAISNAPNVNISGGNLIVTGGDVKADGISLKTHRHGFVQTGSGTSGVPV